MSQKMEDAKEFARMLSFVAECVYYYDRVTSYPDCNTCGKQKTCGYCPKPGEQTRINCPLWENKNNVM